MVSKNTYITSAVLIVSTLIFLLAYIWFLKSPYFSIVETYAQANLVSFIIFLVVIKFVGLIYPPIAGGYFILASIPIIGWQWAFFADIIGTTLGGTVNYLLARKYGIKVVKKLGGDLFAGKVEKIKIKKGREIEGLILLRIFIGFTVLEMIHYAAGLLKIDFKKYTIAMLVSHVLVQVPIYYLFGGAISSGSWTYLILFISIGAIFLYKNKGRYFE